MSKFSISFLEETQNVGEVVVVVVVEDRRVKWSVWVLIPVRIHLFDHSDTFSYEDPVTDSHNDCPWQQNNSKVVFVSSNRCFHLICRRQHTQKE